MEKTYEVIPSAKRLINSLRDIGYNFSTAVADLVDNSIEAGASRIDIMIGFYGNDSYLRISDNGKGMSEEELKEAMRYGSERDYLEEDLGKFGLGLKTASMSQCQRFSVASRTNSVNSRDIPIFCWDLFHIEKTNKWEILDLKKEDVMEFIRAPLDKHIGTVVLWEKLDRIINFKKSEGNAARKKLMSMCRELETHLRMVFHKFLSNEIQGKELEIYMNNNKIRPWDPFARSEPKTNILSPIKIKFAREKFTGKIILQPYILPAKEEFSSFKEFENSSGPAKWNQQQGFYIYRANRMIQSGGWCGLRTSDEHTKLCRIELNFPPSLDNDFKINVAKMRVQLPSQLREEIERVTKPAVSLARECYSSEKRNKLPKQINQKEFIKVPSTINLIDSKKPMISENFKKSSSSLFSFDEIEQRAKEFASKYEGQIISDVFSRLRKRLFGGEK